MNGKRFEYDEIVFKGRVAEVHKVGVRMPDGRVVQRDWICYNGAAVILPILDDGSIVLIRNYRFAVEETLYELPAGMLDDGEDPAVGAARELTEETGYAAGRLEKLGQYYTGPGTCNELRHAFVAMGLSAGPQRLEAYEQIETEAISDADVRAMVADGRIHDAKTIATLCLWWLLKGM
jgi:ADP-ribose pyrophosphatase